MAQILQDFEEHVERHLPADVAQSFKGTVRRKMHALTIDICQVIALKPGEEINGAAVALSDRVFPDARPNTQRSNHA